MGNVSSISDAGMYCCTNDCNRQNEVKLKDDAPQNMQIRPELPKNSDLINLKSPSESKSQSTVCFEIKTIKDDGQISDIVDGAVYKGETKKI